MLPIKGQLVIDINASVINNSEIMRNFLSMHGVSGCDTVAPYFGISEVVVPKVLRCQKHSLS